MTYRLHTLHIIIAYQCITLVSDVYVDLKVLRRSYSLLIVGYCYRAMHFSAKRGIAIACFALKCIAR